MKSNNWQEVDVLVGDAEYAYSTDFTMTMTNAYLPTDDGSNVGKLVQQGNYNGLFNNAQGREFEFKWDIEQNYEKVFPKYVTLPVTFHMNMAEAKQLDHVTVYNAGAVGNGYATKVTAVFNYSDDTSSELQTIAEGRHDFVFTNADPEKTVTSVDITVVEAKNYLGENVSHMLTLAEMKLGYTSSVVVVKEIAPQEDNVKEIYVNKMADINAVFTPSNVTNPYFTASSSNEAVVRIITMKDAQTGLPVYKVYGVSEGTATITLTALENEEITASYDVTVLAGADKTELAAEIAAASSLNAKFYTEASYAAVQKCIEEANAVKDNESATVNEVKQAIKNLKAAVEALEESPVEQIEDISGFEASGENVGDVPSKAIDGSEGTYWESPYLDWNGATAGLPKDLTIALNGEYNLDKVEIVKHSAANGKVIEYEVLVSVDGGESYTSVGRKETPVSEVTSGIRFEQAGVTHVIVRIHAAMEKDGVSAANYARVAEVKFYGTKVVTEPDVDMGALESWVKDNEGRVADEYTAESWSVFAEALANAKEVLAKEDATQEEVDTVLETLKAAVEGLAPKKEDSGSQGGSGDSGNQGGSSDSGNQGGSSDSGNQSGSGSSSNQGNAGAPQKPVVDKKPETTPAPQLPALKPETTTPAPQLPTLQPSESSEEADVPVAEVIVDTKIVEEKASEEVKAAVKETVTVTEEKATVTKDTVEKVMENTEKGATVILPLTEAADGQAVKAAEVPVESIEKIAAADSALTVEFEGAKVTFEPETLKAIAASANGATIELHVTPVEEYELNDEQQAVLARHDVALRILAKILCDGEYIGNFGEGKARIAVPFTPEAGRNAEDYRVYYVAEIGDMSEVPSTYVDGQMILETTHFSEYAIVYEGESEAEEESAVTEEAVTEETTAEEAPVEEAVVGKAGTPILPIIIAIVAVIAIAAFTVAKKKNDEK